MQYLDIFPCLAPLEEVTVNKSKRRSQNAALSGDSALWNAVLQTTKDAQQLDVMHLWLFCWIYALAMSILCL